ncbi:hypothetical protein EW146_g1937 [Bondarzewia mesenterica]|uniref:Defective in cullin neddylation protein n=1 Tax=Bondarzewia mesenterica TaxID=1095465 RepID=A0A4V6S1J5_9AGAM|nr:hypothetical protein EW146_g1937 [Bondarzewia mesenterica]
MPSASTLTLTQTVLACLFTTLAISLITKVCTAPMGFSEQSRASKKAAEEERIAQFCGITGAPVAHAKHYLDKYKRVDIAVDAYYNEGPSAAMLSARGRDGAPSTSKLASLFDKYKEPDGDTISVDGTIKLCEDLGVDPEDVVMLAVAYELKSPRMAEWTRTGWIEGWKNVRADSIATMKTALFRLRDKLGSDAPYFQKVYAYTFDFARAEGQRSLALETAQGFWALLVPHGLQGGALAHIPSRGDEGDENMQGEEEGWMAEYTDWWFEFLNEKGSKGVSKDTWMMVRPVPSSSRCCGCSLIGHANPNLFCMTSAGSRMHFQPER